MKATRLAISDVILLEPTLFSDERGYFYESFNMHKFTEVINRPITFVQDNCSYSKQGVLRGLHYQITQPQGKLVSVSMGEVFDVAVDLRKDSPSFGQWVGEILSADNKRRLWIPEGFAHGFLVLSESAEFQYKVTNYWYPAHERCIRFDDREIGIQWPLVYSNNQDIVEPILSVKDREGSNFNTVDR